MYTHSVIIHRSTGGEAIHLRVTQEVAKQVYSATATEKELQIIGIPYQEGRLTLCMDHGMLIFVAPDPFVTDVVPDPIEVEAEPVPLEPVVPEPVRRPKRKK
ncbi:hypothetical protein [Inquilinus sp. OTU3971]|uniref:hypothetical protein n=1 Tax=Inquilinus sp. OTU3971 TaxID=3043855 RepID=UPI00313C8F81